MLASSDKCPLALYRPKQRPYLPRELEILQGEMRIGHCIGESDPAVPDFEPFDGNCLADRE